MRTFIAAVFIPLVLFGYSTTALPAAGADGDEEAAAANADIGFVAKGDKLPNDVVKGDGDANRLKPLLESLPDGHRLRLEFTTVPKSLTGYKEDLRYVKLVTTVDAAGKPDGTEIEQLDWYRHFRRKTLYKNGVRDGVEQMFFPGTNKVEVEIPWLNGQIHGVKKTFHPSGAKAGETPYEHGKIVGESRSFTEKGTLLRVVRFADGDRDGEMIDYWPDREGKVDRSIPYRKGRVHGMSKAFYADGKPKWERPFRDNRQHGVEKQFAPDGKVERERFWIEGDTVSPEEFKAKFKP
jgi:antitoxin component YwqK of YwqJK toxin-antitoxin module